MAAEAAATQATTADAAKAEAAGAATAEATKLRQQQVATVAMGVVPAPSMVPYSWMPGTSESNIPICPSPIASKLLIV